MTRLLYVGLGVILVVAVLAVIYSFFGRSSGTTTVSISQMISDAKAGQIARISIKGDELTVTRNDGSSYHSRKEHGVSIFATLREAGVPVSEPGSLKVNVQEDTGFSDVGGFLVSLLPLVVFAGILSFFMWAAFRRRRNPTS